MPAFGRTRDPEGTRARLVENALHETHAHCRTSLAVNSGPTDLGLLAELTLDGRSDDAPLAQHRRRRPAAFDEARRLRDLLFEQIFLAITGCFSPYAATGQD